MFPGSPVTIGGTLISVWQGQFHRKPTVLCLQIVLLLLLMAPLPWQIQLLPTAQVLEWQIMPPPHWSIGSKWQLFLVFRNLLFAQQFPLSCLNTEQLLIECCRKKWNYFFHQSWQTDTNSSDNKPIRTWNEYIQLELTKSSCNCPLKCPFQWQWW